MKLPKPAPKRIEQLTPREQEVAQLLCDGFTCTEIAKKLKISVKTIDTHRHAVLTKLSLRHNVDLVKRALVEGFMKLDGFKLVPDHLDDASDVTAARAS